MIFAVLALVASHASLSGRHEPTVVAVYHSGEVGTIKGGEVNTVSPDVLHGMVWLSHGLIHAAKDPTTLPSTYSKALVQLPVCMGPTSFDADLSFFHGRVRLFSSGDKTTIEFANCKRMTWPVATAGVLTAIEATPNCLLLQFTNEAPRALKFVIVKPDQTFRQAAINGFSDGDGAISRNGEVLASVFGPSGRVTNLYRLAGRAFKKVKSIEGNWEVCDRTKRGFRGLRIAPGGMDGGTYITVRGASRHSGPAHIDLIYPAWLDFCWQAG